MSGRARPIQPHDVKPLPMPELPGDVAAELIRIEARGGAQRYIVVPEQTTFRMVSRLRSADLIETMQGAEQLELKLTLTGARLARTAHARLGALL